MTFEKLKEVVDGLICLPCDAVTTAEQPLGTFNIVTFPMEEISSTDNPLVHCFDLIADLEGEVNISELGAPPVWLAGVCAGKHQVAIRHHDPPRWQEGRLEALHLPRQGQAMLVSEDGVWPGAQGEVHDARSKTWPQNPAVLLREHGGACVRCFELSSQTLVKRAKTVIRFEDSLGNGRPSKIGVAVRD